MISEAMRRLGDSPSAIRELFEYGRKRKEEIGAENVYDFSLGNPSIPAPESVGDTIVSLVKEKEPCALHGYTSAAGDLAVRQKIASFLSETHSFPVEREMIYMTCGAAASLTVSLHAIAEKGDEAIVLSPYFPEYRVFCEKAGMKVVEVPCREKDFQPDLPAIEKAITPRTKAILINSPNNPTGAVYSEESWRSLSDFLYDFRKKTGRMVFLLCDEPYRELNWTGKTAPFPPALYDAVILCYSFSKSLSLPGERIGYILVGSNCPEKKAVFAAVCGAGRSLGFVCAPALFQYAVAENLGKTGDLSAYRENREILCRALKEAGFEYAPPDGAFYLFLKAPDGDEKTFCARAKEEELLLVPSTSFGCPGYARASYCVSKETVLRSIPAFQKLARFYQGERK